MSNHLFGWQNYIIGATLDTDSAATNMPPQNLQDDSGSSAVAWQTAAGVTSSFLDVAFVAPVLVSAFGLLRTNLTPMAAVRVTLLLAGSTVAVFNLVGPTAGYGQVVKGLSAPHLADAISFSISDPANPDGFLNVPLAFAGPAWLPLSGPAFSSADGRDMDISETTSRGGQEFPALHWQRRRRQIALEGVRASEVFANLDAMLIYAARGGNVLYIPDIADSNLQSAAIFGRLKTSADIGYFNGLYDRRSWTGTLTERI